MHGAHEERCPEGPALDPSLSAGCFKGFTGFQRGNIDATNLDLGKGVSEEEMGSGQWQLVLETPPVAAPCERGGCPGLEEAEESWLSG